MTDKEKIWHLRYMQLCDTVASWSEDDRKKVGSCLVRENRVLSIGFNGLPTGVKLTPERLANTPIKLQFFEHAERNALYTAARNGINISGATLYCNFFPCTDCTRGIIQSGITTVVASKMKEDSKWYPSMLLSLEMLEEAQVNVIFIDQIPLT